jgi:PAS domain S-box-containing protein
MVKKPSYEELEQRVTALQASGAGLQRADQNVLEARKYAENIVETIREPLLVLDAHLKVLSANRSFFQTFKVAPEDTKGKVIYDIGNHQWDIPRLRELLEQIIPHNTSFDDFEVEHKFEAIGQRIMLLNARRLHGGRSGTEMILLAIEDVTERRLMEKKLSESEADIGALNEQILNMLMVVSHDLKSPLVSMGATIKLLILGVFGKVDESVKNTLNDMYRRVSKLVGTVDECLGKASAVKGALDFGREVLDLREDIIDPVLDELCSEMAEQEIVIDNRLGAIPAYSIPIEANRIWLKIVFRNLFSNAIRYGGKGCTIAFGFEDIGSYYKLNVHNSGEPIAEHYRDKLFKKFFRIEERGKGMSESMGLGLYLTKRIIEKQGGDIWYEARQFGSNFVFTLPHD